MLENLTEEQQNNYNKVAIAVLNGLKMTAAATLFHDELSDLYGTEDSNKLFTKCRFLVHEFCKKRNLEGYKQIQIQDAHGGAQDAYVDSLTFGRNLFLTVEELEDYSYMGDLSGVEIPKIEALKDKSISNGKSARTAIKCAKRILENQAFIIPDESEIDEAIMHLKSAKKLSAKGSMDMVAVIEALYKVSDDSKVVICRSNVLLQKHRLANR